MKQVNLLLISIRLKHDVGSKAAVFDPTSVLISIQMLVHAVSGRVLDRKVFHDVSWR